MSIRSQLRSTASGLFMLTGALAPAEAADTANDIPPPPVLVVQSSTETTCILADNNQDSPLQSVVYQKQAAGAGNLAAAVGDILVSFKGSTGTVRLRAGQLLNCNHTQLDDHILANQLNLFD